MCEFKECTNGGRLRRGYCEYHYRRWLRHGSPELRHRALPKSRDDFTARLLSRYEVNENTGCWLWLGTLTWGGYGQTDVGSSIGEPLMTPVAENLISS